MQGLDVGFFVALAALVVFWVVLNRTTLGYEVRAVGFNPEAAAYGGINVKKNLIRAMAISGAFAGLAGALDMLGYLYHFGQSDIPVSSVGFLGIAVALLGRNTAIGTGLGALLFGALLFGTTHGLSSNVIDPELAGNLTYIIQGLVVLFVGADVLILYVWNSRRKLRPKRSTTAAGASHERSGVEKLDNPVSARLRDPAVTGYAAIALGVFAAFLGIPPIEARTVVWPVARGDHRRAFSASGRRRAVGTGSASAPS